MYNVPVLHGGCRAKASTQGTTSYLTLHHMNIKIKWRDYNLISIMLHICQTKYYICTNNFHIHRNC